VYGIRVTSMPFIDLIAEAHAEAKQDEYVAQFHAEGTLTAQQGEYHHMHRARVGRDATFLSALKIILIGLRDRKHTLHECDAACRFSRVHIRHAHSPVLTSRHIRRSSGNSK
jgi:hypothetical protein